MSRCTFVFSERSVRELQNVLLLLLGCAVQCEDKEKYINAIKGLPIDTQAAIVGYIKQVNTEKYAHHFLQLHALPLLMPYLAQECLAMRCCAWQDFMEQNCSFRGMREGNGGGGLSTDGSKSDLNTAVQPCFAGAARATYKAGDIDQSDQTACVHGLCWERQSDLQLQHIQCNMYQTQKQQTVLNAVDAFCANMGNCACVCSQYSKGKHDGKGLNSSNRLRYPNWVKLCRKLAKSDIAHKMCTAARTRNAFGAMYCRLTFEESYHFRPFGITWRVLDC